MSDHTEVPPLLRRLWRLSEPSRLGRPAALTVEQVVATAVGLADRGGLDGVTLPKVSKVLGVTSMSLYRYVGSKDELLVLMTDVALGQPPDPGLSGWRAGLRHWAVALRELHRRRPWLATVPISGPPSGPNQIAWMDAALTALRGTDLGWAQKVGVLMLVSGYVRQMTLLSQELASSRPEGSTQSDAERDYGRNLVSLVDPDRFPEAAKLFASPLWHTEPTNGSAADNDFDFGLELILDGVHARTSATHH